MLEPAIEVCHLLCCSQRVPTLMSTIAPWASWQRCPPTPTARRCSLLSWRGRGRQRPQVLLPQRLRQGHQVAGNLEQGEEGQEGPTGEEKVELS